MSQRVQDYGSEALRGNALLAKLPDQEFQQVAERAELIAVQTRDQVYEPRRAITAVYFPTSAVFSMVAAIEQHQVEVATIGAEGMVGLPLFLGAATSPHATFCQVPGHAVRLYADDLRAVLRGDGDLHRLLNRCVQATMVQISQNVVCNNSHTVEQRAARWLLTTHDRAGRPEFPLTQDFLAQMLGTRRPTVSETAARLQERGLIRYRRGIVTITDRSGLEALTCPCYGVVRAEFDDLTR